MTDTLKQNEPDLWRQTYPIPKAHGHKYDRGHALIYGGQMTGATRLAARAAQRMGSGLVTLVTNPIHLSIYATALESIIVQPVADLKSWKTNVENPKRNVILIGPGLGQGTETQDYVLTALATKKPCVLDADALTAFADNPETLFGKLNPDCVLTPHEGEFGRLFGKYIAFNPDKTTRAIKAAERAGCTILLKGSETIIANPNQSPITNRNAPPWLATAGAGDVLAGMITGLIAQSMPPFSAAAAAAWLHGTIATEFGLGLIAEDLIDGIPKALNAIL